METHFQNEDIIEFELKDGSKFGYKPMTAGEENDYMSEYMIKETFLDDNGKQGQRLVEDITKINMIKCYNLTKAPYKDWNKLSKPEKWKLFKKLKPSIFSEIIKKIRNIENAESIEVKNC